MDTIRDAIETLERSVERRPDLGRGPKRSVTILVGGLRCRTEEGAWKLDTDLPPALGGEESAPTPSMLARAALGSCLAMMYALRAAREGVALDAVSVTVETESPVAGMLVPDAATRPGFEHVRCHVELTSPCDPEVVAGLMDRAEALSPVLDLFTAATAVHRTVSIRSDGC